MLYEFASYWTLWIYQACWITIKISCIFLQEYQTSFLLSLFSFFFNRKLKKKKGKGKGRRKKIHKCLFSQHWTNSVELSKGTMLFQIHFLWNISKLFFNIFGFSNILYMPFSKNIFLKNHGLKENLIFFFLRLDFIIKVTWKVLWELRSILKVFSF